MLGEGSSSISVSESSESSRAFGSQVAVALFSGDTSKALTGNPSSSDASKTRYDSNVNGVKVEYRGGENIKRFASKLSLLS